MFSRFLIAAPLALAISAAFIGAAAGPAFAATSPTMCATIPGQLRAASSTAPIAAQQRAAILITTGEHLCADRARDEAAKKFAAAARALDLDMAALPAQTVSASAQ